MTIAKAVYDFLIADAGINAAVGGRIFRDRVPQGESFPAIIIQVISTNHNYHLTNESAVRDSRIQIDAYDRGPTPQHEVIAELINSRISGYRGDLNSEMFCDSATFDDDVNMPSPPKDGTDNWTYRVLKRCHLFYFAAVPAH